MTTPAPFPALPPQGSVTWYPHYTALDTEARKVAGKADALVSVNAQIGTAYSLALGDAARTVEMNNAAASTVTVPANATVPFPVGTVVDVWQYGAGQVTLAGATGVTLRSRGGALRTSAQYGRARLVKRAADEWVVTGDLVL